MLNQLRQAVCDFLEPQFPEPIITDKWIEENCLVCTPDLPAVETQERHIVFIYDTMMDGGSDRNILTNEAKHLAYAYTKILMILWRTQDYVVPIVEPIPFTRPEWCDPPKLATRKISSAPIRGQVFEIPTEVLITLDKLKQNGTMYRRIQMPIAVPAVRHFKTMKDNITKVEQAPEKIYNIHAWMYIGDNDYWNERVDGGFTFSPARIVLPRRTKGPPWDEKNPWRKEFYYYNNVEI